MRSSPEPVVINVLGSCRDVATAAQLDPELFAEKCRAVYLNAGSGTLDPTEAARKEWNVRLDPAGYAAIFDLPCPVYWLPCFHTVKAYRKRDSPFLAG
jgi:inosine-uridine nucleoside N-ribohydrolase